MSETEQEMQNSGIISGELLNSAKQETQENGITSAEIAGLWNTYMLESLAHHIFVHFLKHMEDPIIKPILVDDVNATRDSLQLLKSVFMKEGMPIPRGITAEDVNPNAPRLFSDNFVIPYIKELAKFALLQYSIAYTECSRREMKHFFRDYVDRLIMHEQQLAELALVKGTPAQPPHIPIPDKVDFVKKQNFLAGFLGDTRPLTTQETTTLFLNTQSCALGKALMMGFSQIAKSAELQQFFLRGQKLYNKYFLDFTKILLKENITVPSSYDGEVTDSTESPFSDRMMLNHFSLMMSVAMQNCGMSLSMSPRRDLVAMYAKIMVEMGTYADDEINLMIKNGWLEQPPLAPDRNALVKQVKKSSDGNYLN